MGMKEINRKEIEKYERKEKNGREKYVMEGDERETEGKKR